MKFLKTPHPIGFGWIYALLPALLVLFILVVLAPYGFGKLHLLDRFLKALPFGIITALAAPVNLFLVRLAFPNGVNADTWTLGREFLYDIYDILLIGLWNAIYLNLAFQPNESFTSLLLRLESHTLIVGILPIISLVSYKHHKALQNQLQLTQKINGRLLAKLEDNNSIDEISLFSETGSFEIKLLGNQILFLKSDGNYVEVFYILNGLTKKHLIRNRLKNLYQQLPKKVFFQCHKSYIVNPSKITKVDGNARDLKLIMCNGLKVPVSRDNSSDLMVMLQPKA